MANGEITITILSEDSDAKKKEKTPSEIGHSKTKKIQHPIHSEDSDFDISGEDAAKGLIGIGAMLLKDAADVATTYALSEANRYFSLTRDYISQNKFNEVKTRIGRAQSTASALRRGAAKGTAVAGVGGPVFAALGAIIGAASEAGKSLVEARIEINVRKEQYDTQLNATNIQTNFMASRASLVNGGRGTEY